MSAMGVTVERLSDILLSTYRQANDVAQDMVSTVQPSLREFYAFVRSLLMRSTYDSAWNYVKISVHVIGAEILSFPRKCNVYVPAIIGSFQRMIRYSRTWNSSHLCAGGIGLLLGGSVTILCSRYMFSTTKYLTLTRAVVAKHDRGLQGAGFIEEAPVSVIIGPNDVLVHVKAASLDTIDLDVISHGKILRSLFQNKMLKRQKFPVILGRDCTGVVVDIGCNVSKFEIGDEVWLAVPFWLTGMLTEFVSLNESYISHKPERLDFVDAASLPYSSCVALDCVRRRISIDKLSGKGKKVLVHGGHTAVGCIIVQLCAMYNVNITTSCISQAVNKMIDAGAHNILLLDHANPDELSTKRYDVVFNTMGESAYQFCRHRLASNGSLIDASGRYYVPLRNYNSFASYLYIIWLRSLQLFGVRLWKDVPINADIMNDIADLVNEGKLYPVTDSVFNVRSCDRAFWFLQNGKVVGKPVICFR